MSVSTAKLAASLADDVLNLQDASGEDRFYIEVAKVLGASSQTLEEAFLTEIRIRLSERNARRFLAQKAAELKGSAG